MARKSEEMKVSKSPVNERSVKTELVDFYDADLEVVTRENLPTGVKNKGAWYHLRVRGSAVGAWEDGRPRLDVNTEVASGEFEGAFGPRGTFSIGGYEAEKFKISAADQAKTLMSFVKAVHPTRVRWSHPVGFDADEEPVGLDEALLEEIAELVEDCELVALVKLDKNDYMRMSQYHSVEDPPEGFSFDEVSIEKELPF